MKKNKSGLLIGLPTALNILVLLAFACVSMLSLSRARIDYMAAKHSHDVSRGYFSADSRAQLLLGELSEEAALPPLEAGAEMEAALNDQGIAARFDRAARVLAFSLPAGEAGTLSVRLHLLAAGRYEITAWQLVPHEATKSFN